MGDLNHQNGQGAAYQRTANHVPQHATYETHRSSWDPYSPAPSGSNSDQAEISRLRTELSILSFRLDEREKKITEAQSVITYLLKLNTSARSNDPICDPGKTIIRRDDRDITRLLVALIKEVSTAVIKILPNNEVPDRHGLMGLKTCKNTVEGDLLDLSHANLIMESHYQDNKSDSNQDRVRHRESLAQIPSSETTRGEKDRAASRQPAISTRRELLLDAADFPPLPYVTRFNHPRKQETTTSGPNSSSLSQDQSNHSKSIEPSPISFNASSLESNLTTHYGTSESTDFTSLNSSFSSSDNDTEESGHCSSTADSLKTSPIQRKAVSHVRDSNLQAEGLTLASEQVSAVPNGVIPVPSQYLAQASTLFMPKWPSTTFALTAAEREGAMYIHKRATGSHGFSEDNPTPDLFKYGLRIRPNPMGPCFHRTIVIDYLPRKITMFTLLQKVRGGAVADAKLLNTITITGYLSAMITFVYERGARAFQNNTRNNPLEFDGVQARVTLLPTPTWPIPANHFSGIVSDGHTRCLEVHNFPRGVKPAELENDLRYCHSMTTHSIEAKKMRPDGVLELRFMSIRCARRAFGTLTRGRYKGCRVMHTPDPCAQSPMGNTQTIPGGGQGHTPLAEKQDRLGVEHDDDDTTAGSVPIQGDEIGYALEKPPSADQNLVDYGSTGVPAVQRAGDTCAQQ